MQVNRETGGSIAGAIYDRASSVVPGKAPGHRPRLQWRAVIIISFSGPRRTSRRLLTLRAQLEAKFLLQFLKILYTPVDLLDGSSNSF
jgi:hypothetical protein